MYEIYISLRYYRERDLLKGLAHAIMEAKKSQDVPPASWKPRKAGGINSRLIPKAENQGC